jgi:coenzyme F420-reducing hydrogenase delta subunit
VSDQIGVWIQHGSKDYRKTVIARRFADQIRQHHHGISVFWIDASNSERFYESISKINRRLKISGADLPRADVIDLF